MCAAEVGMLGGKAAKRNRRQDAPRIIRFLGLGQVVVYGNAETAALTGANARARRLDAGRGLMCKPQQRRAQGTNDLYCTGRLFR